MLELAEVTKAIAVCRRCPLSDDTAPVPGTIRPGAPFLVVGEAPGRQEDEQGAPFVGPAGKLMRRLWRAVDVDPDRDVSWCNVVSCRPPGNRFDEAVKVGADDQCRGHLLAQIRASKAIVIVLAGSVARDALMPGASKTRATFAHGRWVFHTWHPAYALRSKGPMRHMVQEEIIDTLIAAVDLASGRVPPPTPRVTALDVEKRGKGWAAIQVPDVGAVTVVEEGKQVRGPLRHLPQLTTVDLVMLGAWYGDWDPGTVAMARAMIDMNGRMVGCETSNLGSPTRRWQLPPRTR